MRILLIALCLFIFQPAHGAQIITLDGQETQNGGGAAEQSFAYALTLLKPLYQMCLSVDGCVKPERQREILKKIYDSMDAELANPGILRFEKGSWAHFMRDGQVRVAVTGSDVGDTIYINRSLVYAYSRGVIHPYSLSEAIGVLTHEFGHHHGEVDHELLDMLGANVRAFFDSKKEVFTVDGFGSPYAKTPIQLTIFHSRQVEKPYAHISTFWLSVGGEVFDLNSEIRGKLQCPHVEGVESVLRGFRFFQMHWREASFTENGFLKHPFEAKMWMECQMKMPNGQVSYMAIPHRVSIDFTFRLLEGELIFVKDALVVNVVPEDLY